MGYTPLVLRISVGGMQWRLTDADTVEVWRGTALLGTLSGRMLASVVEQVITTAELHGRFVRSLGDDPPRVRRPPMPLPPSGPITTAEREARKAKRRSRRKPA